MKAIVQREYGAPQDVLGVGAENAVIAADLVYRGE
jgi:hypothetical protein